MNNEYVVDTEIREVNGREYIIEKIVDDYPDLSWLGDYFDSLADDDEYYIDRQKGALIGNWKWKDQDCTTEQEAIDLYNKLETSEYVESVQYSDNYDNTFLVEWGEWEVITDQLPKTYTRNSFKYFGRTQHMPFDQSYDSSWKDHVLTDDELTRLINMGINPNANDNRPITFWLNALYTCEDYQRITDFNSGLWSMLIIRVTLNIGGVCFYSSLGGVESDASNSYYEEIIDDLIMEVDVQIPSRIDELKNQIAVLTEVIESIE